MDFQTRYKALNDEQCKAVDTIDGPVLVVAGPGTGKTELLSMRAANILRATDTLPGSILCLTFTDSGAAAMRERLAKIIGPDAYKVAIHTFHSFGAEIINQNGEFFYSGADFHAADELSTRELLRTIFDELPYSNPLSSKMNDEYTYMNEAMTVISELKKAGLTSDELLKILDRNDVLLDTLEANLGDVFEARIAKTTTAALRPFIEAAEQLDSTTDATATAPLGLVFAHSLRTACDSAEESNSTKPITAWRNTWLKKNEAGRFVFKNRERTQKLRAVSGIYFHYLERMHQSQLYDFDDMILRVVHALEVFDSLRFNLQERYQYIMVDEFQDTNLAQMRIIHSLTNNPVNEGRPNILAVGDDDQAIYSFQGADVSNIHRYRDDFKPELIVLTDNYRSADTILRHARDVIVQGNDRLETIIPEMTKQLAAHVKHKGNVELREYHTHGEELQWLARDIRARIDAGETASEIAVLARRHRELVALLPYLYEAGVSVNYERRDNVLELDVIQTVEQIAGVLIALLEGDHAAADSYLPELLAHPAFAIEPKLLWQLGLTAYRNKANWIETMATIPDLLPLHDWLLENAARVPHTPLERMIDIILGSGDHDGDAYISPLYTYYFAPKQLEANPESYLLCLEALRTIRAKLAEYQPNEPPKLQSFIEFIRMHRQYNSPITAIRRGMDAPSDAIHLMTAHKSKGLEFERVYIIGAIDSMWGARAKARARLINYPENLQLAPSGDTLDERMRLFFVAMTRAKKQLTISFSAANEAGKATERAGFLATELWRTISSERDTSIETLTHNAALAWYAPIAQPITPDMRTLLAPTLERYKLSATHLTTFLDVTRGGPQAFLMQNLLHFPTSPSPNAAFGSAIHETLQRAHAHVVATGTQRPLEDSLHDYEQSLGSRFLSEKEHAEFLQKGIDTLSVYLPAKQASFTKTARAELNFAGQHSLLGDAHLTGSLDVADIDHERKTITVIDYKTGKPALSWTGKTEYEKMKLHRYKQQLMFYHLLVRNSRTYGDYQVENAVLQFVEPTKLGEIAALEAHFSQEDLERFTRLIQAVWKHIKTLDLPDITQFDSTFKGALAFEESLLSDS